MPPPTSSSSGSRSGISKTEESRPTNSGVARARLSSAIGLGNLLASVTWIFCFSLTASKDRPIFAASSNEGNARSTRSANSSSRKPSMAKKGKGVASRTRLRNSSLSMGLMGYVTSSHLERRRVDRDRDTGERGAPAKPPREQQGGF